MDGTALRREQEKGAIARERGPQAPKPGQRAAVTLDQIPHQLLKRITSYQPVPLSHLHSKALAEAGHSLLPRKIIFDKEVEATIPFIQWLDGMTIYGTIMELSGAGGPGLVWVLDIRAYREWIMALLTGDNTIPWRSSAPSTLTSARAAATLG